MQVNNAKTSVKYKKNHGLHVHDLHVLVTRPHEKGAQLTQQLQTLGITSQLQPLFDYQPYTNATNIQLTLKKITQPIFIFVSVAAVKYANDTWPIKHWFNAHNTLSNISNKPVIIAVGTATQQALTALNIGNIICPTLQNSEGVLTLKALSQVNENNIIIVRGDDGREHLAQVLTQRGANVNYLEVYQKRWLNFTDNINEKISEKWQTEKINCIVITSNAALTRIIDLMTHHQCDEMKNNTYWSETCLWIVASQRIADNAKALGLKQVINANSANNQAIIATLTTVISHIPKVTRNT